MQRCSYFRIGERILVYALLRLRMGHVSHLRDVRMAQSRMDGSLTFKFFIISVINQAIFYNISTNLDVSHMGHR